MSIMEKIILYNVINHHNLVNLPGIKHEAIFDRQVNLFEITGFDKFF